MTVPTKTPSQVTHSVCSLSCGPLLNLEPGTLKMLSRFWYLKDQFAEPSHPLTTTSSRQAVTGFRIFHQLASGDLQTTS
jgi:hypothetical protein